MLLVRARALLAERLFIALSFSIIVCLGGSSGEAGGKGGAEVFCVRRGVINECCSSIGWDDMGEDSNTTLLLR